MTKNMAIEAIFQAIDRMSAPMKSMNKSIKKFSKQLETDFAKAQRKVLQFGKNFKKSLGRTAKRAILAFTVALSAGLGVAINDFVKLDDAITAASAKFGTDFQRGTVGFDTLGKAARQMSLDTEYAAVSVAQGYDVLALAGFKAEQAMAMMPSIGNLATASATDIAEASSMAADALGAFGLRTPEVMANTDLLAEKLTRVIDIMAKTATTSNTDLNLLFESIKKGAPVMSIAEQTMETFTAAAGALANMGIKGSESGMALRNAMLRLSNPSASAAEAMKNLGIDIKDSKGNFRDLIDILGDFETALAKTGSADTLGIIAEIFGTRVSTSMSNMLSIGETAINDYRIKIENATGSAEEMAKVMRGSLGNQIAMVKNSLKELGFKFIEAFAERGRGGLEGLKQSIDEFDMAPVIAGVERFLKVATVMWEIMRWAAPIILGVVAAFKLYNAILAVAAVINVAFGASLMATPLGWIILAIGAVIGLAAALILNWGKVGDFFKQLGRDIVQAFKNIIYTVKLYLFGIVDVVLTAITALMDILVGTGVKLGSAFGLNTSGMESWLNKLHSMQESVRSQSAIGWLEDKITPIYADPIAPVSPISPSERAVIATTHNNYSNGEVVIRDETGRAEMTKKPSSSGYPVTLVKSGAM